MNFAATRWNKSTRLETRNRIKVHNRYARVYTLPGRGMDWNQYVGERPRNNIIVISTSSKRRKGENRLRSDGNNDIIMLRTTETERVRGWGRVKKNYAHVIISYGTTEGGYFDGKIKLFNKNCVQYIIL